MKVERNAIFQERIMKQCLWVLAILLLFLLTSCGSAPSVSQPKDTQVFLEAAQTPIAPFVETATNLEPDTSPPKVSTFTPTTEPPTVTSSPTKSATPEGPTQTPTLTPTIRLLRRPTATQAFLGTQIGSPTAIQNFTHPELGCQWMGVAGQVFDIDDTPMMGLVVEFGGELDHQPVFGLAITGQAETYGPGGYEFKFANEPIASSGMVWAQVFDLEGNAISAPTYFSTYGSCEQNLIILNFVQAYKLPTDWIYLPIILKIENQ
jgi:hypothetical protein